MKHSRVRTDSFPARLVFPELEPVEERTLDFPSSRQKKRETVRKARPQKHTDIDQIRATTLSFSNIHCYGELFTSFLRARKRVFIDQLQWNLHQTEGMEFDQYDTPLCRWIAIHEFGQVLGGIRLTPTTARCGIYSYMLRDAQRGVLDTIPTDVLFMKAPVDPKIWEAARLFISDDVPAKRRISIQYVLMSQLSKSASELGASHVIGIVPSVWSRWLRRLELDAVPVGPKFSIDGTLSQAALFNVMRNLN